MRGGERKKTTAEKDEVDQLLEAAQDEVMLNLSVDSHISSVSSDYLDPDLRRRFNALRSRPSAAPPPENHRMLRRPEERQMPRSEDAGETQDDLMARFAALKASLPASSSSSSFSVSAIPRDGDVEEEEEEEEEDEVEKVIKWAMDAARLDPSPESDDEESNHSSKDDDDDDDGGGSKKDCKR